MFNAHSIPQTTSSWSGNRSEDGSHCAAADSADAYRAYKPATELGPRQIRRKMNVKQLPTLSVTAEWRGRIAELRNQIESLSDWGPFELIEAAPVPVDKGDSRRIRCRFIYHGPEEAREHYEQNLLSLLNTISDWIVE